MKVKSRALSFFIILFAYIAAFAAGLFVYVAVPGTPLLRMFLADIAGTLVVWLLGVVFANSSLYDPYWSVAPLIVIPAWMALRGGGFSAFDWLLLLAVFTWGIRLTLNWALRFYGLAWQDWRYTMYQHDSPEAWFVINLFGINLIPTVLVFGGMTPAYFAVMQKAGLNIAVLTGFAVCIASACVQFISDNQMERYKKRKTPECIDEGLWRISRHPNYLGEVSFWWGIWLMQFGALPEIWFTVAGPAAITLLFVFISVPMMEKHVLEKRPSYAEYQKRVPMLVPWFKKGV